jgi:hypothetical protein
MYSYALNNPLKYIDLDGEDIEAVVTFTGNFTDEEKKKILAAVAAYLKKLDIGQVVVRQATDEDKRTLGQKTKDALDFLPGIQQSLFSLPVDLSKKGMGIPNLLKAGDLAGLRERDPAAFIAKVADGILHEILAHQLGAGDRFDALTFGDFPPGSYAYERQQTDPYFQTRKNTLFDHAQWRAGDFHEVRHLIPEDQKKRTD